MSLARYRLLDEEQQRALAPKELEAYQAERKRFAEEVDEHREHIWKHGWLDVSQPGRPPQQFRVRWDLRRAVFAFLIWLLELVPRPPRRSRARAT